MRHIFIGTKAQFIKMAPILMLLDEKGVSYNLIFTGQHKETMDELRGVFGIKAPEVVLYEGKDITGLAQMFFWMSKLVGKTLLNKGTLFGNERENGIVLVHGDTFSTVLGAVLGKVGRLKVAHVESGLRSFDLLNPFPEELARIVTSRLSDIHFCPGRWALGNIEHLRGIKIDTFANTLYDSLMLAARGSSRTRVEIPKGKYGLVSIHRFENIFRRRRLEKICRLLEEASRSLPLLFILHLPTRKQLEKCALYEKLKAAPGIDLRPRYDYFSFVKLLIHSELLVTDGGSNQEEAHYLGKPVLIMRKASERKEGIGENAVISNLDRHIVLDFIRTYEQYKRPSLSLSPSPSEIVVDHLVSQRLA